MKNGKITPKWIPYEKKGEYICNWIKDQGAVTRKALMNKLGISENNSFYDYISPIFKETISENGNIEPPKVILAQYKSQNLYVHKDTKEFILNKKHSPTKKDELVVKNGNIILKWISYEKKPEALCDWIKNKKVVTQKMLTQQLGINSRHSSEMISPFLQNKMLENGTIEPAKIILAKNNSYNLYVHRDTQNFILNKKDSPTNKKEKIVEKGKITLKWVHPDEKGKAICEWLKENEGATSKTLLNELGNCNTNLLIKYLEPFLIDPLQSGAENLQTNYNIEKKPENKINNKKINKKINITIQKEQIYLAQLGNKYVFIHKNTKHFVINKRKKNEEIVVQNAKITDRWLNNLKKIDILQNFIKENQTVTYDDLKKQLPYSSNRFIYDQIDNLLNEKTVKIAQFGKKSIIIHKDTKKFILNKGKKNEEVIMENGKIVDKWLSNDEKRMLIDKLIEEKKGVTYKNIREKLPHVSKSFIYRHIDTLFETEYIKIAQFGRKKVMIHKDTENFTLQKIDSPTKKEENVMKNGKIVLKWIPNEQKGDAICEWLKNKGAATRTTLMKELGISDLTSFSNHIKPLLRANTSSDGESEPPKVLLAQLKAVKIYIHKDTKNFTLLKKESPTKKDEIIVKNGKIMIKS
jgi:predicted HTH transcriptional regulator